MTVRAVLLVFAAGSVVLPVIARGQARPPDRPNFSGDWVLNRQLSDEPSPYAEQSRPGERPHGGRGTPGGFGGRRRLGRQDGFGGTYGAERGRGQSAIDPYVIGQQVAQEARTPSPSLTISHSPGNIAITDAHGRTRFFQTNGARDKHQFDAGTVDSTTSWNGEQLVTQYDLGSGHRVTYNYSIDPATRQLIVRVRTDGDAVGSRGSRSLKFVYDLATPPRR
jgi:hypothetical protein